MSGLKCTLEKKRCCNVQLYPKDVSLYTTLFMGDFSHEDTMKGREKGLCPYLMKMLIMFLTHTQHIELCGFTAFRFCVHIGVFERMRVDQRKFGKSSWTAAVERMERLRCSVAKETLQLQRAREICLEQKKHTLREEVRW